LNSLDYEGKNSASVSLLPDHEIIKPLSI
jgi:hypothetical protein